MHRPLFFAKQAGLIAVFAFVFAFGVMAVAPSLNNPKFLLALPVAAVVLMVMTLNFRWMMVMILMSRALLDTLLILTRLGAGAGIGGVLNFFVILMVLVTAARYPRKVLECRFLLPWAVLLAAMLVSVYFSPMRAQSIRLWLSIVTYVCMFFAPFLLLKDENDKAFWVRTLLVSSLFPVLIAFAGFAAKFQPMMWDAGRLNGTFAHSNILAFFTVLMITIVLYVFKTGVLKLKTIHKLLLGLYLLALFGILLLTQTRSAWLACAMTFFIFALFKDKKMLIVLIVAGAVLTATPVVQSRLGSLSEGHATRRNAKLNSFAWRMKLWESAVPSILQKPVLGHGLGTFQFLSKDFFYLEKKQGAPAHNVYVEAVFETGLVGLLAYISVFAFMIKAFFRRMWRTRGAASSEALIGLIVVAGHMLVSLSDNMLYYLAFNWYFFFFVGLMLASMQLDEKRPAAKEVSGA